MKEMTVYSVSFTKQFKIIRMKYLMFFDLVVNTAAAVIIFLFFKSFICVINWMKVDVKQPFNLTSLIYLVWCKTSFIDCIG